MDKEGTKVLRGSAPDDDRVFMIGKEKYSRLEARAPLSGAVCPTSPLQSDKTQQGATKSKRVHVAQC